MFIEPYRPEQKCGWIEVICGSMFSGKTEELIRRINRAIIARQEVRLFKPKIDVRYDDVKVVSHNSNSLVSIPIERATEIWQYIGNCEVVGIDEAQFLDSELVEICNQLADRGIRVIVSGLDMDYKGKPFGVMPALMGIAEFVTKVRAICVRCGAAASYSYRLDASTQQVLLGAKDIYEPRCRHCFNEGKQTEEISLENSKELINS